MPSDMTEPTTMIKKILLDTVFLAEEAVITQNKINYLIACVFFSVNPSKLHAHPLKLLSQCSSVGNFTHSIWSCDAFITLK